MREFYAAALPANVWNWVAVWRHNYLAWKKVAFASILGNLADPMIYLFGLGFGFGIMVGRVDGASYIAFLAAGMVATSAMTSATFETIYAAFSRMHVQRMWEAILCTQLTLGDIVLGELAWAATKAFFCRHRRHGGSHRAGLFSVVIHSLCIACHRPDWPRLRESGDDPRGACTQSRLLRVLSNARSHAHGAPERRDLPDQ